MNNNVNIIQNRKIYGKSTYSIRLVEYNKIFTYLNKYHNIHFIVELDDQYNLKVKSTNFIILKESFKLIQKHDNHTYSFDNLGVKIDYSKNNNTPEYKIYISDGDESYYYNKIVDFNIAKNIIYTKYGNDEFIQTDDIDTLYNFNKFYLFWVNKNNSREVYLHSYVNEYRNLDHIVYINNNIIKKYKINNFLNVNADLSEYINEKNLMCNFVDIHKINNMQGTQLFYLYKLLIKNIDIFDIFVWENETDHTIYIEFYDVLIKCNTKTHICTLNNMEIIFDCNKIYKYWNLENTILVRDINNNYKLFIYASIYNKKKSQVMNLWKLPSINQKYNDDNDNDDDENNNKYKKYHFIDIHYTGKYLLCDDVNGLISYYISALRYNHFTKALQIEKIIEKHMNNKLNKINIASHNMCAIYISNPSDIPFGYHFLKVLCYILKKDESVYNSMCNMYINKIYPQIMWYEYHNNITVNMPKTFKDKLINIKESEIMTSIFTDECERFMEKFIDEYVIISILYMCKKKSGEQLNILPEKLKENNINYGIYTHLFRYIKGHSYVIPDEYMNAMCAEKTYGGKEKYMNIFLCMAERKKNIRLPLFYGDNNFKMINYELVDDVLSNYKSIIINNLYTIGKSEEYTISQLMDTININRKYIPVELKNFLIIPDIKLYKLENNSINKLIELINIFYEKEYINIKSENKYTYEKIDILDDNEWGKLLDIYLNEYTNMVINKNKFNPRCFAVLCFIVIYTFCKLNNIIDGEIKMYTSTFYLYDRIEKYIDRIYTNEKNNKYFEIFVQYKKIRELHGLISNIFNRNNIKYKTINKCETDLEINNCDINKINIYDEIFTSDNPGNSIKNILSNSKTEELLDDLHIFINTELKQNEHNSKVNSLYEYIFGNFMRDTQINLINKLNVNNILPTNIIHQMIMGEGKSSVIIPIMSYMYINKYANIFVIVPYTLVSQSYNMIFNTIGYICDTPIKILEFTRGSLNNNTDIDCMIDKHKYIIIMSDSSLKALLLEIIINGQLQILQKMKKSIFLYDEIDDIVNPSKSELNYPEQNNTYIPNIQIIYKIMYGIIKNIYSEDFAKNPGIDSQYISTIPHFHITSSEVSLLSSDKYLNVCFSVIEKSDITCIKSVDMLKQLINHKTDLFSNYKLYEFEVLHIIYKIVKNIIPSITHNIHNVHFGLTIDEHTIMSTELKQINNRSLFAVPYLAANVPSEHSEFSDYYYVIGYTILSYINKLGRMRISDIFMLSNYISNQKLEKYHKKFMKNIEDKTKWIYRKKFKLSEFTQNDINTIATDSDIIKMYFKMIILQELKCTMYQYNVSAYDILSHSVSSNRIGFSGTPFIPDMYDSNDEYSILRKNVNLNNKDFGAIVTSIKYSNVKGLKSQIIHNLFNDSGSNILNSLINIIQKNDYDSLIDVGSFLLEYNSEHVARILNKKLKKVVIFIDPHNVKCLINNETKSIYYPGIDLNNIFVYFDNQHITGIDIKQKSTAIALVTFRENTKFRDISQGIFRMRKINKGQSVNFVSMTNKFKKSDDIIITVLKNENKLQENNLNTGTLQNIRTLVRLYNQNSLIKIDSKYYRLNNYINIQKINDIYETTHDAEISSSFNFFSNIKDSKAGQILQLLSKYKKNDSLQNINICEKETEIIEFKTKINENTMIHINDTIATCRFDNYEIMPEIINMLYYNNNGDKKIIFSKYLSDRIKLEEVNSMNLASYIRNYGFIYIKKLDKYYLYDSYELTSIVLHLSNYYKDYIFTFGFDMSDLLIVNYGAVQYINDNFIYSRVNLKILNILDVMLNNFVDEDKLTEFIININDDFINLIDLNPINIDNCVCKMYNFIIDKNISIKLQDRKNILKKMCSFIIENYKQYTTANYNDKLFLTIFGVDFYSSASNYIHCIKRISEYINKNNNAKLIDFAVKIKNIELNTIRVTPYNIVIFNSEYILDKYTKCIINNEINNIPIIFDNYIKEFHTEILINVSNKNKEIKVYDYTDDNKFITLNNPIKIKPADYYECTKYCDGMINILNNSKKYKINNANYGMLVQYKKYFNIKNIINRMQYRGYYKRYYQNGKEKKELYTTRRNKFYNSIGKTNIDLQDICMYIYIFMGKDFINLLIETIDNFMGKNCTKIQLFDNFIVDLNGNIPEKNDANTINNKFMKLLETINKFASDEYYNDIIIHKDIKTNEYILDFYGDDILLEMYKKYFSSESVTLWEKSTENLFGSSKIVKNNFIISHYKNRNIIDRIHPSLQDDCIYVYLCMDGQQNQKDVFSKIETFIKEMRHVSQEHINYVLNCINDHKDDYLPYAFSCVANLHLGTEKSCLEYINAVIKLHKEYNKK